MASVAAADSDEQGTWAGYLLGFALGGFFDGILLHQILQWHHLLLGVEWEPLQNMRAQVLADGLFHLLMYVIAMCGIVSLWRARGAARFSGSELCAHALIGFGAWHVLDGVLSHWILGIHRIKMDSPNPLAWDLFWFVVFGLVPLMIGLIMRGRASASSGRRGVVATSLVVATIVGGIAGTLPPTNVQQVAVLVPPSQATKLLDALPAVNGSILWADRSGALWVFNVRGDEMRALYDHGALFVTRSPAALGCLAWSTLVRANARSSNADNR